MSDFLAVYDLSVSVTAYDFFTFLVLADVARREAGSDSLDLLLVPADGDGLRAEVYDLDQNRWRLRNIVMDGAGLLPSCRGVLKAASRDHARRLIAAHGGAVFPQGYSLEAPVEFHKPGHLVIAGNYGDDIQILRASAQARTYARQWLDARRAGRKPVALTLRESKYTQARNTNLDAWIAFAGYLSDRGYFPFILRDIETALDVSPPMFDGIAECPAAVFNVDLRIALYELSYLGVFSFNGPAWPCTLSRHVRLIAFPVGDAASIDAYYAPTGFRFGEAMPILNHLQRYIWQDPTLPALIEAFEAMERRLDEHDAAGCPAEDRELDPAYRVPTHRLAERLLDIRSWRHFDRLIAEAARRGDDTPELRAVAEKAAAVRRDLAIDEDIYRRAARLRLDGNIDAAIALLQGLIARRPTEVLAYLDLGQAYETAGLIREAEHLYRTAVARRIANAQIVHKLGCIALELGDLDDARACFEMLLGLAGDQEGPVIDDVRVRLAEVVRRQSAAPVARSA